MMTLYDFLVEDLQTWSLFYKKGNKNKKRMFLYFFLIYPEYRVLVKTRMKAFESRSVGGVILRCLRYVVAIMCQSHNLFIYTTPKNIGRRLIFHHGFSTMISATSIGDDCHIF